MYNVIANAIVLAHFLFIAFVVCGGLLVIYWPRIVFVHLPTAVWGAVVEIFGWVCPLTTLENYFRLLAGHSSYNGDFIARYLLPVISSSLKKLQHIDNIPLFMYFNVL